MRRLCLFLALAACTQRPPADPPPDDVVPPSCGTVKGAAPVLPEPICRTSTSPWKPGVSAFRDATSAWGLDALKVEGVRLSVADFDGDGWVDLVARRVGVRADDFTPGLARSAWLLRNDQHGHFVDVSQASGFFSMREAANASLGHPGEVIAFGDVDNDGDLDGYLGLNTADPAKSLGETSELLLNDGHGLFTLGPAESALRGAGAIDSPASVSFTDFDLDGRLDAWVPRVAYAVGNTQKFAQDRLFKGDGAGGFTEATDDAGLTTKDWGRVADVNGGLAHSNAWSGAACDLTGDGVPELLAASYGRAPNHLFQGAFDGSATTYTNESVASGYAFDGNETWEDNQFARCYCETHRTAAGCADVPNSLLDCSQANWSHGNDRQPFRLGGNSGTTTCADLDNDGDLDLVTSEIKHWWAGEGSDAAEVLVNTGGSAIFFERPGRESMGLDVPHTTRGGWDEGIMTNAVFDFDNDGWKDLYLGASDYAGNHGLLFHHKGAGLSFETVPITDGIDHHRSHGVVAADFDRDGDLDVLVGHSRSRCEADAPDDCYATPQTRLFENVTPGGNWLQVHLAGACEGTNRAAIGARVTVEAGGVKQVQEVDGGHGHFGSQNDLVLHFGLGAACSANVTVQWPNAARGKQTHTLGAGHRWAITEGSQPHAEDP